MDDDVKSSTGEERFLLPDLGEGLAEAEIVAWHVQPGDRVVADQPLVAVETDKAIVDIPSPHAGQIEELHAAEGERLAVGDVLVTFAGEGRAPDAEPAAIAGELPERQPQSTGERARVKASPRARRRARELGVALADIESSGADDIIEVADVEAAVAGNRENRLSSVRRAMAKRMAESATRVARATVTGEANVNRWPADTQVLPRLIRAVTTACSAQPLLNASFDDKLLTLTSHTEVHLGIAMDTEEGLFVPVMRNAHTLDAADIAAQLDELKAQIGARSIDPTMLRGQTITLSNFGVVGGHHAEMVVVPPQVAIVGAGRAFERLVIDNNRPVNNRFLPLSISFDHRAITGAEACEFLNALVADLELIY